MPMKPFLAAPAIPKNNRIMFILPDKEIYLDPEVTTIAWDILSLCNGLTSVDAIVEQLANTDKDFVIGFLDDLSSLGIIVDSREIYKKFHSICANPATYTSDITDEEVIAHVESPRMNIKKGTRFQFNFDISSSNLVKLQEKRSSCRNFATAPVSINDLGKVLNIGYSLERHAVPSAGNLYPMKLFVIALKKQTDFPAGYYEYDNELNELVLFNDAPDSQRISHIFNSIGIPFKANLLIIISADANRQPYKYSNLGYRFMAIEAGEIVQNISLGASEIGLETCCLGGIREKELSDELQIEQCLTFLAMAIGKPSDTDINSISSLLTQVESEILGAEKPVRAVWLVDEMLSDNYDKSYFQYLAETKGDQITSGVSMSWHIAKLKAIVEGYERQRSTTFFYDTRSSAQDLSHPWLDPRIIAPLTDLQYAKLPHLQRFNEDLEIEWIKGTDFEGNSLFIPIDLVFYSIDNLDRKLVANTSSSGFAAYTDQEEAINRGILEIIERDSLMRYWYEKRTPCKLDRSILPTHLRNRVAYWTDRDRNVFVLDLSQRGVIVVEVIIVSDAYPCLVSGASSSLDSFEEASIKAFQEAESRLIHGLNEENKREIRPEDVCSVLDHELLYAQSKQYHERVNFLFDGKLSNTVPQSTTSLDILKEELEVITVDISEECSTLNVIKAISPKLVPVSFGFGAGHHSHTSLTRVRSDYLMPHYFA